MIRSSLHKEFIMSLSSLPERRETDRRSIDKAHVLRHYAAQARLAELETAVENLVKAFELVLGPPVQAKDHVNSAPPRVL
jgi:hypothetical protein